MTEMKNNRDLMENIFVQAILEDAEGYIFDSSADVNFSEKHQLQMKHILKSSKHWYWSMICNAKRRIAVAVIAATLLLLAGCSAHVGRDAIVSFVHEVYERYFAVKVDQPSDEEIPESIETEYTFSYLPDGYELIDYQVYSLRSRSAWQNEIGDEIVLLQTVIDENVWFINDQYQLYETVIMGENHVNIYFNESNTTRTYLWSDGNYNFTFHCPLSLDESVAIEMLLSIENK